MTGFNILQGKIWESFMKVVTSELTFEDIMGRSRLGKLCLCKAMKAGEIRSVCLPEVEIG